MDLFGARVGEAVGEAVGGIATGDATGALFEDDGVEGVVPDESIRTSIQFQNCSG